MQTLIPGHKYLLSNIKSDDGDKDVNILKFYDEQGANRDEIVGTSNQEVLRALIDRVSYLDNELPHSFNKEIIFHLRKALILHEARHLIRMVDKDIAVEEFPVGKDGHLIYLDKEKEHSYQDEIANDDLAEYNGSTLTDIEKDMSKRLNAIDGATSLLFQEDNQESDDICNAADNILNAIEKVKETKGYKEKILFLKPTEDRLVMQDTNMPSITEAIHNATKQDLSRKEKISIACIASVRKNKAYSNEKCFKIDIEQPNNIFIQTDKKLIKIEEDIILRLFETELTARIVNTENFSDGDIAIFVYRDYKTFHLENEIIRIDNIKLTGNVELATIATIELVMNHNSTPISAVLIIAHISYNDMHDQVMFNSKDGYGINNWLNIDFRDFIRPRKNE